MKRRITFTVVFIAITCGILLSLPNSHSTAAAPRVLTADSGAITLGPGQKLRITVNGQGGNDALTVRFRRMSYSRVGPDINGVMKYTLAAEDTSAPITVTENEAVWVDIDRTAYDAVRGVVIVRGYTGATTVNSGITFQIINANGEVQSILIALLLP